MFVLVRVEKTDSVYTIQIRQWAKPALWGKSKHSFPRGHPVEKKAAVHKWVKPGVKLLLGELKLLFAAAESLLINEFTLATSMNRISLQRSSCSPG